MTPASDFEPKPSPWLSLWFKPGDTIERILATKPRGSVLLLAGIDTVAFMVAVTIAYRMTAALLDWRNLVAVVLIGLACGVAFLYINVPFYRLSGRLLGGRASQTQLRAVLAWGMVPRIIGLAIFITGFVGLEHSGIAGS